MATILSAPARPKVRQRGPIERIGVRVRRIAVVAALVALVPTIVAYVNSMSGPSNTALGVRTVEWLRDNGAAGIVAQVETWYYSLTAPPKGGHLKALPKVGDTVVGTSGGRTTTTGKHAVHVRPFQTPAAVKPIITPALPGEGVWRSTRAGLGRTPPLLVTTMRDEPAYPQFAVGLVWIDTRRTQTLLYAGRLEPAISALVRGPNDPMEVPAARRGRLLATFNSGFKLADSLGGYTIHGRTYAPMKNGLATLIGYRDGRVNILSWTHGPTAPSSVLYARQNLPLIVDRGQADPKIANASVWGATVGNAVLVWRSGIGIDRYGNLIYAAGPDQTASSLAAVLIRAGAVRAMELDINSYWVSFITYAGWGALAPTNLLPDMNRVSTRYLTPDDRDFFAVYLRHRALP